MTTSGRKRRLPSDRPASRERAYHAEVVEPRILLSSELGMGLDAQGPAQSSLLAEEPEKLLEGLSGASERNFATSDSLSTYPPALDLDALGPYLDGKGLDSDFSDYLLPDDKPAHELIFVDTSTADYEFLIEDIRESARPDVTYEIILIDGDDNGLEVIADTLREKVNVDAIHLLSHGEEGRVKFGNLWLTSDNIDEYASIITDWSLEAGADFLIYGCNLGANSSGLALIHQLATMTGTDIAASDNLTGAARFNADWDLEIATGKIETPVPFSDALIASWLHVLAPPTTSGIADVDVVQGASNSVINLLTAFSDAEDADSDLIYSIETNTNSALFDSVSLDLLANTLTLAFDDDVYGTADITVKATDLDGDTVTTTFTVDVSPESTLLLSTSGDAAVSVPGLGTWDDSEIIQFGGSGFSLGTTTAGSFSSLGNIAGDIDGLHYVTSNLTIGTANTIAVQPGDLLISLGSNATLTSTAAIPEPNLGVTRADIILVRPDVPGDYSAVNYFMFLDDVTGGVEGVSLVEEDTIVGDALLKAGDILIAPGNRDVNVYTPQDLSDATTGTVAVLIDGDDQRDSTGTKMINRFISGVELVENTMVIGGVTVNSGNVLLTVAANTATVLGKDGVNPDTTLTVTEFDVFIAEITRSSIGTDPLEGTATLLLEGADVDLSDTPNKEDIDALSIFTSAPEGIPNTAPIGVVDSFVVTQGASLTLTDTTTFVVRNDIDADGDTLSAVLITMPTNAAAFTFNTDGSFSYTHDGVGTLPDSFTYAVGDGKGGISTSTVTININPLGNNAPTATNLTATASYNEGDLSVDIANIVVSDIDVAPVQTITATLTLSDVTTGVLTTSGAATYNALTGVWTITDTLANVNTALASVSFTPAANNDVDAVITTHIEDQDGAGPADGVVTLDVTPINDPPTASNLTTVSSYNEGDASVAIATIVVSESDTNPAQTITATLTLSDVTTGVLTTSGAATYNALTGVWTITDTLANVNTALASVSFTPAANNDVDAVITTHIEDQDGAGPADGVVTLDVTPINDPPTASNLTTVSSYNEGDASVAIATIVVSESDTNPAQTITATLTLSDVTTGVLTTSGAATYNALTGVWTITDTLANVNTALASVSFTPAANNDVDAVITTHIEDQDGSGPPDGSISLDVIGTNSAPTGANSTIVVAEDSVHVFAAADFPFADTDAGDVIDSVRITGLEATGRLTLSGLNVALNQAIDIADINAGLLVYTPDANGNGTAYTQFNFAVNDGTQDSTATYVLTVNVTASNDAPTGALTISGVAEEGSTISADISLIEDADGLGVLSYQWSRDGLSISGAQSASYSIDDADVGTTLSVEVTYVDDDGTAESLTASIGPVVNLNDAPVGIVSVTGVLREGETVSAETSSLSDDDGIGVFSFQWQRNGVDIIGALGSSYLLTPDDADALVSVAISYVDDNGTSESVTSSTVGPVEGINDAPLALGLPDFEVEEDSPDTAVDLSAGFEDPDEDDLSYLITGNSDVALFANTVVDAAGVLTLDYAENASGQSSITIQASDPDGATATTTFTVTVSPVVDLPIGTEDLAAVAEAGGVSLIAPGVLANDVPGDAGDLSVVEIISGTSSVLPGQSITGDTGGTFIVTADGAVQFQAGNDFQTLGVGQSRDTTVVYVAEDLDGNVVSVPIRVTVMGTNDPVLPQDDDWSVTSGGVITTTAGAGLLSNDSDADSSDSLVILSLSNGAQSVLPGEPLPGSAGGTFVVSADGSFSFEPGADFVGLPQGQSATTFITYEVTDSRGSVKTANLVVNVVGEQTQVAGGASSASTGQSTSTDASSTATGTTGTTSNSTASNSSNATESSASQETETDTSENSDGDGNNDEESSTTSSEGDSGQDVFSGELQLDFDVRTVDDVELVQFQNEISVSDQLSSTVTAVLSSDINAFNGLNTLTLQGFDARDSASLIGTTDSLILISSPDYSRSLDESRAEAQESAAATQTVKGGSLTISAGISIGYVIYLIRSGVILSSVLTALPAWRLIDPLPILGQFAIDDDADEESIEEIIQSGSDAPDDLDEQTDQASADDAGEDAPRV